MRTLSLLEARVLGVLIEKESTVPDTYPLSLNSLVSGCNQKTSRDPVMSASETDAQGCVDALKGLSLVTESSGAKVMRYGHNAERALKLPSQSVALLAVLMLRGPQTAGELRINSERLHRFADISSVETFLTEMAERDVAAGGPLVMLLPRAPGSREARWTHLLCGIPEITETTSAALGAVLGGDALLAGEVAMLKNEVARLNGRVDHLEAILNKLTAELGMQT
jgi:uncharacterized protein YceH (UPF0502 family)